VYAIAEDEDVTTNTFRNFRNGVLGRDDVFQPKFYSHIVFAGPCIADLKILPDEFNELTKWPVKSHHFLTRTNPKMAPGPYVFHHGKTWQPWRVYYDSNACFMTALKPSADNPHQ
jgi:hypothetical protein